MFIECFPYFLSGLFIQCQHSGAGLRTREHDQQRSLNQRRRPATHFFYLVFLPKVLLPDNLAGSHLQTMHKSVRSNGVNPSLLYYRSGCWTRAALGNERPFPVMLFIDINPKHLAGLFVEAMQALSGCGFGQFHIKDKRAALGHDGAGESSADRMAPFDF